MTVEEVRAALPPHPDQTRVLATGVFDMLHSEHVEFLRRAAAVGGILIVALESDARVRKMKGEGRPVHSQQQRLHAVQQLPFVDYVCILPEQFDSPADHRNLLHTLQPDILAVSSHSPYQAQKLQLMQEIGGTLQVVHEHNPAVSTTLLLEQNSK